MYASQDGNREFISLLVCICADGSTLLSILIYLGKSQILQDIWILNWMLLEKAYFAILENGWSYDQFGLSWLECIFKFNIKEKTGNWRCLLIIDSYFSYINMQFIEKCNRIYILLLILLLYFIYCLQPLDISLFSFLIWFYINGFNQHIYECSEFININKRYF